MLTAVGWKLRQTVDRRIEPENQLREDRIEIYNQILEPFVIILMSDAAWEHNKQNKGRDKNEIAIGKMLSFEYRKLAFKLSLVGSDAVVLAYNELMQFLCARGRSISDGNQAQGNDGFARQLSARYSPEHGGEFTGLTNWQMLEWFTKDVRNWSDA